MGWPLIVCPASTLLIGPDVLDLLDLLDVLDVLDAHDAHASAVTASAAMTAGAVRRSLVILICLTRTVFSPH